MDHTSAQERRLELADVQAIRLLASPLRNDMLVTMLGAGPCSIAQLAKWLERPPSSLYFHMEKMEAAGLVERASVRRKERHEEVLYAVPAAQVSIPHDDPDPDHRRLRGRVASVGLIRLAERIEKALAEGRPPLEDGQPSVGSLRSAAWFDEHGLARFRALAAELNELVADAGEPAPHRKPMHIGLAWVTQPPDAPPTASPDEDAAG